MTVKVVNLNLWYGGKYTWDNIKSYLLAENPDILFLQEVFEYTDSSDLPYMRSASTIKELLSYPYSEYETTYFLDMDGTIIPNGNAILSKFPITNKKILWTYGSGPISGDPKNENEAQNFPRNLLHCQCNINGKIYNIISTQGVWASGAEETQNQKIMGEKIVEYISKIPNVILAGDFNLNEKTGTIKSIEAHLVNLFKSERKSSFNMLRKDSSKFGDAVVDFIFVSKDIKTLEHYTPDVDVSDHQSQVAVLDL